MKTEVEERLYQRYIEAAGQSKNVRTVGQVEIEGIDTRPEGRTEAKKEERKPAPVQVATIEDDQTTAVPAEVCSIL